MASAPNFNVGRFGVILFFAISGFVIALQRSKPVGEFVTHRILRIYPSYWLALIIEAVLFTSLGLAISTTPAAFFLYPSVLANDFTSVPYWTLVFEMTFYALAAAAFAARLSDRTLTTIAVLWILAANLFAPAVTGIYLTDAATYAFPGFPNLLWSAPVQVFPMGLIVGIHFDRLRRLGRWRFAAAALVAFLCSWPLADFSAPKHFAAGICTVCIILAAAEIEVPHPIKRLGDASYGIYLMHFPVIIFIAAGASKFGASLGLGWLLAAALAAGVMFGLFDHWLYRRLVKSLKPYVHQTRSSPKLSPVE